MVSCSLPRAATHWLTELWLFGLTRGAIVALCLFASQAAAQPSAQDRERARGLLDLGDAKFAAHDYEAALQAYQAADAIMGVPTTGIEVGRALEKLGRLVEARDAFIGVTRFPARHGEPKAFTAARQRSERLASELGPRIPAIIVTTRGLPSELQLTLALDGEALEVALLGVPIKVDPGAHRLTGSAPGFVPVEREITLAEGESQQLALEFTPQPLPPLAETASEETPASAPQQVPQQAPRRTWLWLSVGVAAAGLAAGGVTGIWSLLKTRSIKKDQCGGDNGCPASAKSDIDSATLLANVSNVALAVGAVGVGVGVWQFFATRKNTSEEQPALDTAKRAARPSAQRARVRASIGPGRLGVEGTF
jgi:hypothetical protein